LYTFKKFILLFIFLYTSLLKAQISEDISNRIIDFSAKISKGQIYLQWKVVNPHDAKNIKVEVKKAGSSEYQFLTEINITNYDRKEVRDSLNYYYFSYKNKPN
jgi:hypothetical protein